MEKSWEDEYAEFCRSTDGHGGGLHKYVPLVLGLCSEAGEVAGALNKEMRRAEVVPMVDEIGDVLWYLTRLADEHGLSLRDLAIINRKKLERRKAAKTLHTSGDNR